MLRLLRIIRVFDRKLLTYDRNLQFAMHYNSRSQHITLHYGERTCAYEKRWTQNGTTPNPSGKTTSTLSVLRQVGMSRLKLAHNALLRLLRWYENLSFPCTGSSSSTMFEIFLSRINKVSLFRETSQVYVNNMHKINSLYTILLLFFNFFPFFIRRFGR